MRIRYLVLACTLFWSCRGAVEPADVHGLRTAVELDRSILTAQDTVIVTVTVLNPTSRPIRFMSNCRAGVFRVYRNHERIDRLTCAIPEAELIDLGAGQSLRSSSRWTIVEYRGAGLSDTLPSGTYTVVGGVDVRGELKAQSVPVAIEVRRQ